MESEGVTGRRSNTKNLTSPVWAAIELGANARFPFGAGVTRTVWDVRNVGARSARLPTVGPRTARCNAGARTTANRSHLPRQARRWMAGQRRG